MFKTSAIAVAVVLTSALSFARIPGRAVQSAQVRPAAEAETAAAVTPAMRAIVLRNVDVKKLKKIVASDEPIALPLTGGARVSAVGVSVSRAEFGTRRWELEKK